jgi:hypothetical protein
MGLGMPLGLAQSCAQLSQKREGQTMRNSGRVILIVMAVGISVLMMSQVADADGPAIGINLAGVSYWTEELPWTDVSKGSQPLFSQEIGQSWGVGVPLTLREDGYPAFLPENHMAQSLWDSPRGHVGGQFVVLYDGSGHVGVSLNASEVSNAPGRVEFTIPAGPKRMLTRITETDPADPVRNIRIVPLARESDYVSGEPAQPFSPELLGNWDAMQSYRFMDWGSTNNSPVVSWSQRGTPDYQTQSTSSGVALEYMVQLANQTSSNPWFCVPHQADDDYVRNMARLIRDNLDSSRVARIEYSNEVWNSIFQQASYARSRGLALGLSTNEFQAQLRYYSQRSVEVFDIFEEEFTHNGSQPEGVERLSRIMATQSANPWVSEQVLSWLNAYEHVDALAVAPYFGETVTSATRAGEIKAMTWEQRVAWAWDELDEALQDMADQKTVADDYGVSLFAYESGQHFVGGSGQENDQELTDVLNELNRRPEMRDMYLAYLQGWETAGGEDMMLFSSVGEFSKWGSWGLLEYETQDPSAAPKMLGVLDYLATQGVGDIPGDANRDGIVSDADYTIWADHYGASDATWSMGDFNGNGTVTEADYTIWADHYGQDSVGVPEPLTGLLCVAGGLALRPRRRR